MRQVKASGIRAPKRKVGLPHVFIPRQMYWLLENEIDSIQRENLLAKINEKAQSKARQDDTKTRRGFSRKENSKAKRKSEFEKD